MPKTKGHIAILLAFLVLLGMIVSPVCAGYQITAEIPGAQYKSWAASTSLTYDASQNGMAIQRLVWDLPTGTTVDYTLWYGNGSTVSGQMIYTNIGLMQQHTEVSMGGAVSGYDYVGLSEIGRVDIAGYAKNETSSGVYENGLIIYDSVWGLSNMKAVAFYPTTGATAIYKVSWTSNNPITSAAVINPRATVESGASKSILDIAWEWINFAITLGSTVMAFVVALLIWIKFLFVDNLLLVVALWIAVTMAYSAISVSGNQKIFKFYKKFFGLQRALLNFIMELWNYFIQIISAFRGIFRL